jgi:NTE family protein
MSKIGIALSGGGSRCVAQLGAIKFLEEKGLHFSAVSGSSGGAIAGALYASGRSPDEILALLKEIDFKSFLKYYLHKGSLYKIIGAEEYLRDEIGLKDFETLQIPFYCTVVNFKTGLAEYKNSGDLAKLILASCALTPVFAPVEYAGETYIDGGFYDNLPAAALGSVSEKIVGINVNPMFESLPKGFKKRLMKSLFIMLNANVREGKRLCNLYIEPHDMSRYSIFDIKNFDIFYEIGYREAQRHEKEIDRFLGEL